MKFSFLRRLIACCFALLLTFVVFSTVSAQAQGKAILIVAGLEPREIGEDVALLVQLKNDVGDPIPGQLLSLYIDGNLVQEAFTDPYGLAYYNFRPDLPAGRFPLRIVYLGTPGFQSAEFASELVIEPVELTVQVIPPLSGIVFSLDHRMFQSGEDGVARIMVHSPGVYQVEFHQSDNTDQPFRAEFRRWEPDFFENLRNVSVPETTHLVAGFKLNFPVDMVFVDNSGQTIDPERITSITLRSSQGATLTFGSAQQVWLQKNRIVRRLKGLDEVNLQYTVQSVILDGSNVVNRGQQRFEVASGIPWEIELLLYSVNLTAKEAVFRLPIGNSIELRYPDGHIQEFPLEVDHHLNLGALARGVYYTRVKSNLGISVFTPLVLSRNQRVELLVYSYLTIALAIILPVGIALSLLIVGRTRVR